MTRHVHHWHSVMIFEENTRSLFTSDLFIQPGQNKPVILEDLSKKLVELSRVRGIVANEEPRRKGGQKLVKLNPKLMCPMHASAFNSSVFPRYIDAIMNESYAYSNRLLGKEIQEKPNRN
jgi:flavorubredoxin